MLRTIRKVDPKLLAAFAVGLALISGCRGEVPAETPADTPAIDPLLSWNDGDAKRSIVEFVGVVTAEGGPDYVAPAERIAVFDNDGTLWAEQPRYFQLEFALDRVQALAPEHPDGWTVVDMANDWNRVFPFEGR